MISHDFADFAVAQRKRELDDDVYSAATRAVVDWFSATVAGAGMEPAPSRSADNVS